MRLLQLLLYGATLLLEARAARILFTAPVALRSHAQFYSSLAITLAKQGHEVTFLTPYEMKDTTPGVREIALPELQLTPYMPNVFQAAFSVPDDDIMEELCANGLQAPQVQQLFDETFDLMMMPTFWSECFLVFEHHLRVPLVLVLPMRQYQLVDSWFGNPSFPSYNANLFVGGEYPLSFVKRTASIMFDLLITTFSSWKHGLVVKTLQSRGLLPDGMPPFEVFFKNASLLILNSYLAMETPTPHVMNIIHAGGLHIRPTKPLPQDLEEWVQGAGEHGFIYFSLGSVAQTSDIPEKLLLTLLRAFGRLPQRVLMKWNEDHLEGLPDNVRLSKWLPQQDILAHPKIQLFITHGGLNSIQEALYHGVPVLGMPIISDQRHNVEKGSHQGWALSLLWWDMTEESLMSTLDLALNDTRLRDKTRWMSAILRDQPRTPAENVVYWVDYVLRHGGAHHLRCPAADMNWFFLYNVDIWLTVVTVILIVVVLSFALLRCLLRRCCCPKTKAKAD
ncbi:UDP-glucosyltransferase 2-like [Oratosquilla oratoria]|uniref:UDP-glucosyltransferase 2-like n=1 Tax=Oratosquilla oratoria TaxID=337810 RepID=UPI003F76EEC1